MAELNLEWIEAGRLNTRRIVSNPSTQQQEVTRIGRDPSRCDIVLTDGSVSGLHVEIGYDSSTQKFYVQNLRESNPPIVNNQPLMRGRTLLQPETTIQLGNVQLRAIALYSIPADSVPATNVYSPAVPPIPATEVAPHPPHPNQNSSAPSPALTPTAPIHAVNAYDRAASPPSEDRSKSPWLILGFCSLLLGLFILAWPNISAFFGIGRGRVVSESTMPSDDTSSDKPEGSQLSMADLEPYTHPSGLFAIEVPENWDFLDNSRPGELVIQGWRHPKLNAYVIVRIFATERSLNRSQLQAFGANLVDDLFGDLEGFQRGNPTPLADRSVRVLWNAQEDSETLQAATFVRQDGLNLSALTVWIPENSSNRDALQTDIDLIVASYGVDPEIAIP